MEKLGKVQCLICNKVCDSYEAVTHWKCEGHNTWKIILPDLSYIEKPKTSPTGKE